MGVPIPGGGGGIPGDIPLGIPVVINNKQFEEFHEKRTHCTYLVVYYYYYYYLFFFFFSKLV